MKNFLCVCALAVLAISCQPKSNTNTNANLAVSDTSDGCPAGSVFDGLECIRVVSSDFSYIVMSDPQMHWGEYDDNGERDPADPNSLWDGSTTITIWDSSRKVNGWTRDVISSLSRANSLNLQPAQLLVVNGDLTDFGRTESWNDFNSYYNQSTLGMNVYPGLGNHDYQNNYGDCYENWSDGSYTYTDSTNKYGCAAHMRRRIDNFIGANGLDREGKGGDSVGYDTIGQSRSYYWTNRNWVFFQLHNWPGYEAPGLSMGSAIPWLRERINYFSSKGKKIALNFHNWRDFFPPNGGYKVDYNINELSNILSSTANVAVIFAGHIHSDVGWVDGAPANGKQIPVFRSGSPMFRTLLHVKFSEDKFTVTILDSSNGVATAKNSYTYSTSTGKEITN